MKKSLMTLMLSAFYALSFNAQAATKSANLQSTASLQSFCTLTAQNINVGNLNFMASPVNVFANGGLSVLCSKGISYTITPEGGFGKGNVFSMTGTGENTDILQVGMRKGPDTPAQSWDKETGKITGVGTGQVVSERVYIIIPYAGTPGADNGAPNQFNYQARPDNYTATVTALITY